MDTIDTASGLAHEAIDKIADAARKALGGKDEPLSDAERQMLNDVRDYIHNNPIASVGIGAAAGFVLSRLLINR